MNNLKGGMGTGAILAVVFVVAIGVGGFAYMAGGGGFPGLQAVQDLDDGTTPAAPVVCDSTTTPTVTITTPDLYGGAAVTTKNIYRLIDGGVWTEIAGAGTFTPGVNQKYEFLFGIGDAANEDDAEPYGAYLPSWTVPCQEVVTLSAFKESCDGTGGCGVIDDSLFGDLTVIATDPEDGNTITAADPLDLDSNEVMTVKVSWQGASEEDFGNRFCEDVGDSTGARMGNVLVFEYNTTEVDRIKAQPFTGGTYPTSNVNINRVLTTVSGYSYEAYEVPTMRSNAAWVFNAAIDADDSIDPTLGNVTMYLYDVQYYIDNDVTPPAIKCGIFDEDANEVGATAPDTHSLNFTPAS